MLLIDTGFFHCLEMSQGHARLNHEHGAIQTGRLVPKRIFVTAAQVPVYHFKVDLVSPINHFT
jgi:hypothetical protein